MSKEDRKLAYKLIQESIVDGHFDQKQFEGHIDGIMEGMGAPTRYDISLPQRMQKARKEILGEIDAKNWDRGGIVFKDSDGVSNYPTNLKPHEIIINVDATTVIKRTEYFTDEGFQKYTKGKAQEAEVQKRLDDQQAHLDTAIKQIKDPKVASHLQEQEEYLIKRSAQEAHFDKTQITEKLGFLKDDALKEIKIEKLEADAHHGLGAKKQSHVATNDKAQTAR